MKHLLIFTLLFFAFQVQSQYVDQVLADTLDSQIEQYFDGISPGMAVGIVENGEVVYEKYIGYSNLEHEIKIDANTRFNIASNAKQFTALCILKLVSEGKLDLDDDIRTHIPDLFPNIEEQITISNLLNHTSGIRDYCDLLALTGKTWWKQFIDNGDAMDLLRAQTALNFVPGTEYLYSNSNYILLAEIIKKVTGDDFSAYAKSLFETLGMDKTSFLTNYTAIIPNKARPYGNWNGWREEPSITEVHGDGALYTTLNDQLQWEQIVQINNGERISKEIINVSQSPIENSITKKYGYGLEFDDYMGLGHAFHNGATGAYNANFLRFPTEKISIVVMANNRNVNANYVAWQIATRIFDLTDEKKSYPGKPDTIEKLISLQNVLGVYQDEDDGTLIKIVEKEGSLYREIYQRDPVKLINERDGLFAYETIRDLKMNFTNIGKTKQQFTLYMASQQPSTYHKLTDLVSDDFDKGALNGRFYNEETGTEIILEYVEGNTYSLTKNGRERKAELIYADFLRMNSYEIMCIRDSENNVTGLRVNNRRIKNVIFNRT